MSAPLSGAGSTYTEQDATVTAEESWEQAGKDAVCHYARHLILGDDKFRDMLHAMVDPNENGPQQFITCQERIRDYCSRSIANPYLSLFRDKLKEEAVEAFLDLELDSALLAKLIATAIRQWPHLIFNPDFEVSKLMQQLDVEELFVRIFSKHPLEHLTEEYVQGEKNRREEEKLEKKRANLAKKEELKGIKVKGNQQPPKDHTTHMTAAQRAAAKLDQLAGDNSANAENAKANKKELKAQRAMRLEQQLRPTDSGNRGQAQELGSAPVWQSGGGDGDGDIEEYEKRMGAFIERKALKIDYFQRSFWNSGEQVLSSNGNTSAGGGTKAKLRWQAAALDVIKGERAFHQHGSRCTSSRASSHTHARDRRRRSKEGEVDVADLVPPDVAATVSAAAAVSTAVAVASAASSSATGRGDADARVIGLDESNNAIWGTGRGTTRLRFAVDERVDGRRYTLLKGGGNSQKQQSIVVGGGRGEEGGIADVTQAESISGGCSDFPRESFIDNSTEGDESGSKAVVFAGGEVVDEGLQEEMRTMSETVLDEDARTMLTIASKSSHHYENRDAQVMAVEQQRLAAAAAAASLPWLDLEFGTEGELGLSCAQQAQSESLPSIIVVQAVAKGSLAAQHGLRAGTLLRAVAGERVDG